MFERFTERARQVVVIAQSEARLLKHNYIGTEHLLLGLLREEEGVAARVLDSFDVTVEEVRAQVARKVGQGDEVVGGQIPFTPRSKKILELSLREALDLGHNYIGTEHVLLGLMREDEGVAVRILLELGASPAAVRAEVLRLLTSSRGETGGPPPLNWEYAVRTLEGATETWPEQLTAWRREGWEVLTVVQEDGRQRALLERRVAS
jgi:ATP-dependent Clp protease ATP-binding subunit ClpC